MVLGALVAAAAVTVAVLRRRPARFWPITNAAVGIAAAVFVFDLQRGGLGASAGGAVLALAAGAIAVLIMTLFRSV